MALQKQFTAMWDLILRNHRMGLAAFPPELLVAMFWEETAFTNKKQDFRCKGAAHRPNPHQK